MLDIYAGKTALKVLRDNGFKPDLFNTFLGASGGPKWFTLFGLDKYLFGEFFKDRNSELNLVGSSAGAFRAACFAQKDPLAAITRMATSYAETVYSSKATRGEITEKAIGLLDYMLGENGIDEILQNPVFKAHFLVNKSQGLTASENKLALTLGLAKSFVLNKIDRKLLRRQYQRFVFKAPSSQLAIEDYCGFDTRYIDLTRENLKESLLASGSIPLVMAGIKDIPDAPKGMYRDGGIVDYHFDIKVQSKSAISDKYQQGLILYPHFNANPKAGWFDKNLKRSISAENYDNTVMLVPSDKFVTSLPHGKIPDRTDFTAMAPDKRIHYWKTVLSATEQLAQALDQQINRLEKAEIKPII
ncbi:patatin-like phospholipase family protein [Thalassomonas actiniarum]|uniref:Patatin-like phospholipase family protein n=1 Tax=Thalassomonas actiniarum TaxID=485447 RepID=A0AAF0BYE3_9GAMM|nr:patatin-like phospholipase family protein [Thalassomonas actiniarum]WDD97416.1 patatin-like phospholipase family protein [Thalassomonas actiniarum]